MGWVESQQGWLERARAAWSARPERVEPAHVRLWFSSPVAWDGYQPVMLDSIVHVVIVELTTGKRSDDVFADAPANRVVELPDPFARVGIGGWQISCASMAFPSPFAVESVRFRRKRTRVDALGLQKVMLNGGAFKALNTPVPTLATPYLDFFVLADVGRLQALLPSVLGVSRDYNRGFGSVFGFEVRRIAEDRSVLHEKRPQRPIPAVVDGSDYDLRNLDPESYDLRECGVRGPYWHVTNQADAVVPNLSLRELRRAA